MCRQHGEGGHVCRQHGEVAMCVGSMVRWPCV